LIVDEEIGSGTSPGRLTLAAKVCGDWSKALNELSQSGENHALEKILMLDGPYGGTTLDFGEYETVLLVQALRLPCASLMIWLGGSSSSEGLLAREPSGFSPCGTFAPMVRFCGSHQCWNSLGGSPKTPH